jgi:hypothetical protein
MNSRFALVLALISLVIGAPARSGADDQSDRVAASFVLARGRTPSAGEHAEWVQLGALSMAELIARHRQILLGDPAARRATLVQAHGDAFGRGATEEEVAVWTRANPAAVTYTELMQGAVEWLAEHPDDYESVLHRAYQFLLRRDIYPEEIDYWKKQSAPLPYALLVGCIEDWARRNQPGLMVTNGTATISVNSEFLTTVRLPPALAAEARTAAGLVPSAGAENAVASGHNLVAAGADRIVTGGRIHFVAAGGGNVTPARATER